MNFGCLHKHLAISNLIFSFRNYRCHPDILKFISSTFYGDPDCLVPCIERQHFDNKAIKPLYFVDSNSDEEMGKNACIINRGEAKLVAEQVEYLWYNWPKSWGEINIGVAVPYAAQVSYFSDSEI